MLAFQKFCQTQQSRMSGWMIGIGTFTALGVLGAFAMLAKSGMAAFSGMPFMTNLVVQGPAAILMLLIIMKINNQYLAGHFFTPLTLALAKKLAMLAMLFALVIEPGAYSLFDYYSPNAEIAESVGVISYLAHVNLILAIVGFALHLTSAVNKISREFAEENSLTV